MITALDPRTALVLADLQEGIALFLGRDMLAETLRNARRLADAFRERDLPVVLVRVAYSPDAAERPSNRTGGTPRAASSAAAVPAVDFTAIMHELDPRDTDLVTIKRRVNAFHGTDLDLQLRARRITGIVLGGVATSIAVESTGRAAYDHGYNVTFASDAMTDFSAEAHNHSVGRVFPYFGEVDTTDAVLTHL